MCRVSLVDLSLNARGSCFFWKATFDVLFKISLNFKCLGY